MERDETIFHFFFMHNTLSCLKVLVRFIHYSVVSFLLPASLRVSDSLQNQGKLGMKSNFNEITTNFLESSLLTENCMNFENFYGQNEIIHKSLQIVYKTPSSQ